MQQVCARASQVDYSSLAAAVAVLYLVSLARSPSSNSIIVRRASNRHRSKLSFSNRRRPGRKWTIFYLSRVSEIKGGQFNQKEASFPRGIMTMWRSVILESHRAREQQTKAKSVVKVEKIDPQADNCQKKTFCHQRQPLALESYKRFSKTMCFC